MGCSPRGLARCADALRSRLALVGVERQPRGADELCMSPATVEKPKRYSASAMMRGGFAGSLIGGGSLHRSQWPELLGQVQHRRRASGAVAEAAAVDGD